VGEFLVSDFCGRTSVFASEIQVLQANWNFARELKILLACLESHREARISATEHGISRANSEFCKRTQFFAGELGVVRANSEAGELSIVQAKSTSCGQTQSFAGELNISQANSLFCERTPSFASELVILQASTECCRLARICWGEPRVLRAN
jgi:hypothetical protein